MDIDLFRRDEIWFVERNGFNSSELYSLDNFKERYDKKLSKAYLEGRYGAISVFTSFQFREVIWIMAIRTYTNWNKRESDKEIQKEPYKKYFFICEGVNTEQHYFKHLIDIKKTLEIKPVIDMRLLEKDNEDSDISFPLNLIEYANKLKSKREINFDKKHDKMVVIFDADIFEFKSDHYDN